MSIYKLKRVIWRLQEWKKVGRGRHICGKNGCTMLIGNQKASVKKHMREVHGTGKQEDQKPAKRKYKKRDSTAWQDKSKGTITSEANDHEKNILTMPDKVNELQKQLDQLQQYAFQEIHGQKKAIRALLSVVDEDSLTAALSELYDLRIKVREQEHDISLFKAGKKCMVCGCTDVKACEGGCSWVAPNLCSKCAGKGKR